MGSVFSALVRGTDIRHRHYRCPPRSFPLTLPWHRRDWLRVVENYLLGLRTEDKVCRRRMQSSEGIRYAG
ncbi:hypothetical protein BDW42DRAFT_162520 [Aspergillus taichungensis]|uniref:Uncharacterized protein n=1 Tax=Aspergillus taichungensis TaxID=482145 RepID=A0A2J5I3R3_9EURO|nr:hypothetical protein BDW42DRAFT_162520 [Aspergillus taichungensis]